MLALGVLVSIFTAVVATRAMLSLLAGFSFMSSPRVLCQVASGDRWKKYDFIGRTKIWFAISGVFLVVCAISLGVQGLNRGIDFTGGSQLNCNVPTDARTTAVTNTFNQAGIADPVVKGVGKSQNGDYTQFQVKSHALPGPQQHALLLYMQ